MKVFMVSGSLPPEACGIGDYTRNLVDNIRLKGAVVVSCGRTRGAKAAYDEELFHLSMHRWTIKDVIALAHNPLFLNTDIIHLQYPGLGYGASVAPLMLLFISLALKKKAILTVHEYSNVHPYRRAFTRALMMTSDMVLFTSEFERNKVYLGKRAKSLVIPISFNINSGAQRNPVGLRKKGVTRLCYFGLFYPGKGADKVIEAFVNYRIHARDVELWMIGRIPFGKEIYYNGLRKRIEERDVADSVKWFLDAGDDDVASLLCESHICILPFDDGATFRRTSLLTAAAYGVPIITTRGDATPKELHHLENVFFADDVDGMIGGINFMVTNPATAEHMASSLRLLVRNRFSWGNISEQHLRVYRELLNDDLRA